MSESKQQQKDPPGLQREIFVNTREHIWPDNKITYRQVVALAYPDAVFDERFIYTVTYSKGEDHKPKGEMVDNDTITVKKGMVFDVERADRS
jgi:hypothetical protein